MLENGLDRFERILVWVGGRWGVLLVGVISCWMVNDALSMPPSYQAKVSRVVDGDTVEIEYRKKYIMLNLAGVDAPEKGQFYGLNARGLLSQWVKGKYVTVIEVESRSEVVVARLYVNGRDVAGSLVSSGAAWVVASSNKNIDLIALQVQAKIKRKGVWQKENPVPPWQWREKQ